MTKSALARRLANMEQRHTPAGAVVVCWCMIDGVRGEHAPDCAARDAGEHDHVVIVTYGETAEVEREDD